MNRSAVATFYQAVRLNAYSKTSLVRYSDNIQNDLPVKLNVIRRGKRFHSSNMKSNSPSYDKNSDNNKNYNSNNNNNDNSNTNNDFNNSKNDNHNTNNGNNNGNNKNNLIYLTVCSCHVTYAFQSESTLSSCLNVKELVAQSRRKT